MSKSSYQTRISRIIGLWRRSGRPSAREALHENPDMKNQGSVIMDLALAEYRLRRESGEQLTVTRFCDQFSTYRDELRKMLDVENGISNIEAAHQVPWPKLGETFLEFNLQSILGTGAASRVYLAQQTTLGNRKVALKVTPFGSSEAQTLGKLRHRNVVPVLSIHDDPQRELWAVCMPYLGSATLLDVKNVAFREHSTPKSARVILEAAAGDEIQPGAKEAEAPKVLSKGRYYEGVAYVGAELAEGLAYTHSQGVLHRDLKPSNVLITSDGCPMLLDFNLAWDAQRESFRLGGTVPYMPPEQLYATFLAEKEEELPDDPRSDVFSLGVILFELLTGRLPFAVDEHENLSDTINNLMRAQLRGAPSLRELLPGVPRRLAQTIDCCLLVEVSGRPQPLQVARELRRYGIRPQLRGGRSMWTYAAFAAAIAIVLSGSIFAAVNSFSNRGEERSRAAVDNIIDTPEEHLQQALRDFGSENYLGAAKHLEDADDEPRDPTIEKWLAYCYCCAGKNTIAEGILINLVDDDDPTVLNNYAHVLIDGANEECFSIAKRALDRAIELEPKLAQAYFNRAYFNLRCPSDQEDSDGGVSSILQAVSLTESPPPELHIFAAQIIERAAAKGKIDPNQATELVRVQTEAAAARKKELGETQTTSHTQDNLRHVEYAPPAKPIPIRLE